MHFLRAQVLEFSHHLSNIETTDVLRCFWDLAKFFVLAATQGARERHMIMYLFLWRPVLDHASCIFMSMICRRK